MANTPPATRDPAISILERRLSDGAVVLYDTSDDASRVRLNHLVVAESGVWVIASHADRGRIERRSVGRWRSPDHRLFIDGRDQSMRVSSLHHRADGVRGALRPIGLEHVPVRSALVFADGDFGRFPKRFSLYGVEVTWPDRLAASVSAPGTLPLAYVHRIADQLGARTTAN